MPPPVSGNPARFEGDTTYHDTYKGLPGASRDAPHMREYTPNSAPFDGACARG